MTKKKRFRIRINDDFFNDFFDMNKFEDMFNNLISDFPTDFEVKRKPLVMGFSMRFDEQGNPIIERFGDVKRGAEKAKVAEAREPLVDINKTESEIVITAEMPGVERKDLDLKIDNNTIVISVGGERKFYKQIPLTEPVDPDSIKAKLNNGILEIVLKRVDSGHSRFFSGAQCPNVRLV